MAAKDKNHGQNCRCRNQNKFSKHIQKQRLKLKLSRQKVTKKSDGKSDQNRSDIHFSWIEIISKSYLSDLTQKIGNNQCRQSPPSPISWCPNAEKKKVFEKFYRSGDETVRNTKGTGLGLYLCKRIAESHNGKISIANNQPAGSIFNVEFKV